MANGFPPFQPSDSAIAAVMAHWRQQQDGAFYVAATANLQTGGALYAPVSAESIAVSDLLKASTEDQASAGVLPDILLQATVVTFGDKTNEGQLIEAVAIPWFEIIRHIERNPNFMFEVDPRKLEEIIAGGWERAGFPEVVLTPRSADGGRDVIATKPGFGSVRIFDQVKAYRQGHRVTADEVRAMLGVLSGENVSKGLVTTTSDFAPRLLQDEHLKKFIPYRLELKNGQQLCDWLIGLAKRSE